MTIIPYFTPIDFAAERSGLSVMMIRGLAGFDDMVPEARTVPPLASHISDRTGELLVDLADLMDFVAIMPKYQPAEPPF